ncbi:MAG: hypothetical protein L3J12_07340 [Spirochaetales bacterium]|nr:hypothetical protein [Spirochaetales bacterium]
MVLKGNRLISIYLILKKNEDILDRNQQSVKFAMEKEIFNQLSIEEMESIQDLYEKQVDILGKKK